MTDSYLAEVTEIVIAAAAATTTAVVVVMEGVVRYLRKHQKHAQQDGLVGYRLCTATAVTAAAGVCPILVQHR